MKKSIFAALLVVALYQVYQQNPQFAEQVQAVLPAGLAPNAPGSRAEAAGERQLAEAYQNRVSDVQVGGSGRVIKILADDTKGSRHQKFILKLVSGQTLLVAHNIDLAPRLDGLRVGDSVTFYGEYEWNKHGGVLHWTHHDPAARHVGGWLELHGRRYQ
ncbi:DUF3465 domain-containing protein [Zhongshania aliphaticivorans]|uniref:DUF3465 domain-containing protein n=1 Tax=Zhongshania aliphaticivorans TaxID=1470434 RepID=UPI0012E44B72|nr:DUF3465 domain-containing protein [Zhongshania aliphaticivorans]CAA0111576.1 Uncharacterised protein [Zhongshania aliphaticivorans]